MIRSKVLVLRTLGGNKDNSNARQMAHDHIWDNMNNGEYGIADYYQNQNPIKNYDVYSQIITYNHGEKPSWDFDDIAFIVGIYSDKYYSKFNPNSSYDGDDSYPSILYPYRNDNVDFIRFNQRFGSGMDIAFQFYGKIKSIKSVELDEHLKKLKLKEFNDKSSLPTYMALCYTLSLDSFLNSFKIV